ncbi:hypothetical protein KC19_7G076100 [Ceratodon purpureus]|uniref:Splicing factor U2af large subunit n=1 Tax=Ceratodon purpureus TaxID=3225 RepID=A0A8T0H8N7_CERPU|nr:hypothetical protein KC19_7G076100 [Ceratodon purpureus]
MTNVKELYEDYNSPPPRLHLHLHVNRDLNYDFDDRHKNGNQGRKRKSCSHKSSRDRGRSWMKDKDREKDQCHMDDRDCDRDKGDKIDEGDCRKQKWVERRSREYGGQNKRRKHRSYSTSLSRSPSRTQRRSRSKSPSRSHRKKTSGFDVAPPNATILNQIPGMPPAMFPFGGTQFGGLLGMPTQAMTQQATRHARRVYVGGLPPMANEQRIATYFSQMMASMGGNTAGPGDAVINVYINQEKKSAFVEMRTVEEASNAMALNGIIFEGVSVKVKRPSDYNPLMAAPLGPSQPSPHLNLGAVGLTLGSVVGGANGLDRIFIGGLPYHLRELQIKELLESFGPLQGFDLVKDHDTGNSKGYGFCVYQDPSFSTDLAIENLNGLKIGNRTLSMRRASASGKLKSDQENVLAHAQQHIAMQKLGLQASEAGAFTLDAMSMFPMMAGMRNDLSLENPTKVVALTKVVTPNHLKNNKEYQEILEDMKFECEKYGNLVNVVIPRPRGGEEVFGLGKVFLQYSDIVGAANAKALLHGQRFDGNLVVAKYYPEDKFEVRDFGG